MPIVPTFDELYAAGSTEALARNPSLTDRRPGSAMDALIGLGAVLADESIRLGLQGFKAMFFDTATGDDLDALVSDRTGLTRNAASSAVGAVTFTRSQIIGQVEIPLGTRVSAIDADGTEFVFETIAASVFVSGAATVSVPIQAQVAGPESNVAPDEVVTLLDALSDPEVTVTNPARTAGGDVAESDERLRARVRRYYTSLRRGTVDALEAGALTVPGVNFATVDESNMAPEDGGYVNVFVGDPDANANAELVALVEAELENWRAAGVAVQVEAMVRQEVALEFTMRVKSLIGVSTATLESNVRAAVIAYADTLQGGAKLYLSRVLAEAIRASSLFLDGEITNATVDIEPTYSYSAIRVVVVEVTIEEAT
jgi:uncharacterized phage protein gp47/JayE